MSTILVAAAALGLIGSLHCIGMCGPIVLAGAVRDGRLSGSALGTYLLGRFCSYTFVGAMMGQLGEHALHRIPIQGFQALLAALVALFAAAKALQFLLPRRARLAAVLASPLRILPVSAIVRWLPRRGLALGLATGFLPCGLLFSAWLLAAASGSSTTGALTMAVFFAVTTPILLMPLLAVGLAQRRRLSVPVWLQGAGWLALAGWLAIRPLLAMSHHH